MKWCFIAINLLLMTGISWFGVKAGYQALTMHLDVTQPQAVAMVAQPSDPSNSSPSTRRDYGIIPKRNLFKTVEETKPQTIPKPVVTSEPVSAAKPTKLQLKLWGTVFGSGTYRWAVIEDKKTRKQELRSEGDMIQNARIKKILEKKIILEVNGQDEVLEMEKLVASKGKTGSFSPPNLPFKPSSPAGPTDTDDEPERMNVSVAKSEIEDAVSSLNNLMKQAKIRPHFRQGKPDGLTVTRIRPDSIFKKLGLRNGDIIKGVDGQTIESVDDGLKFYNSLRSGSTVSVEIERRGNTKIINYTID